ncbi:MAG: hypothetical protein WED05_08635 [Candidatus Atabeyarchaeum deiterrae]
MEAVFLVSTNVKIEDIRPREENGVGLVDVPRGTRIHNYRTKEECILNNASHINPHDQQSRINKQISEGDFMRSLPLKILCLLTYGYHAGFSGRVGLADFAD